MTEVIVVGAGPTGLMLAGELALAGVDVTVLERRTSAGLVGTRARGFHARTIELLDQRGIADRFLAAGQTVQALAFDGTPLPVADLPTRHPYTLALGQSGVEEVLLGWVEELGVPVRRGVEVTGFTQDDGGVDVHVADDAPLRTAYLVGADGGRSVVRRTAGIELVGAEPTRSHLIAEVAVTEEAPPGIRLDEVGIHAVNAVPGAPTVGVVVTEQELRTGAEPSLADLRTALVAAFGTDFGAHDPTWISRFTDAVRQASAYRSGRVLIAGDAAHVHPPTGGQGIGLGVQDAVNLGWKLAQVVRGDSPDALLDTYRAERHPATARVLGNVTVQALLQRGDARTGAVRDTFAELLAFDQPRLALAGLLTGLDIHLDLGDGHPLLGRRVPDLDLVTPRRPDPRLRAPPRRPAAPARARRTRHRHRPLGRPGAPRSRRPA
ncbi:FAD-dependent monooxygenase [Nocardioides sp. TF02-7]|uniref:FAD-dependent monooxygenase n=1 Tax=Nocardioides sp. TF02-7 TaxID=2917724 RepID=UPI001F060D62|nr:FAD-dependent monooxygenase [Nocardioides sp. TF02-7]UMG92535.1 FAD-dependent monooxygenase [Nocardioides sp. TF02-7]